MYSSLNYLLAALLGAAAPPSQTATPLTWDAAVARVTTANAELAAAQAELRASEYQEAVARSAFLPAVSANIGYDRSDGRALGTGIGAAAGTVGGDSYSATLNATQNIFAGGADAAKIERAQANTRLARARAQAVAAKLSYELKTAFQGLVFAQAYERLTQEIVRRRSDNLRLVELRFDGGRENKGSVLLSQAYRQQALYDALQARNATRIARAQLAKLLRADTAVEYTVADSGVPMRGEPLTPAAPGWIWAARTTAPTGKPVSWTEKFMRPGPVMAPEESRGAVRVIVAVPRALASALVTGGTSLAALSAAVKTIGPVVGLVGELLPQPAAAVSIAISASLFMVSPR